MFGANFFADIDFDKTQGSQQYFKRVLAGAEVELSGDVLKLNVNSVLVFDIKKFNLKTGKMSDYGFAIQPLIHNL